MYFERKNCAFSRKAKHSSYLLYIHTTIQPSLYHPQLTDQKTKNDEVLIILERDTLWECQNLKVALLRILHQFTLHKLANTRSNVFKEFVDWAIKKEVNILLIFNGAPSTSVGNWFVFGRRKKSFIYHDIMWYYFFVVAGAPFECRHLLIIKEKYPDIAQRICLKCYWQFPVPNCVPRWYSP